MSKKNETKITETERVRLVEVQDGLTKAENAHRRAEIALALAQQDNKEHLTDLTKRYKLVEGDAMNPSTGEIVRKTAPAAAPARKR